MNFDLKAIAAGPQDAWDLTLTANGQEHRVRELSLEDFAAISRLAHQVPPLTVEQECELLAGLFHDPRPDVAAWTMDVRDNAMTLIGAYLNAFIEKKRNGLRRQVEAALNTAQPRSTSGRR